MTPLHIVTSPGAQEARMRQALCKQMAVAQAVLTGPGYTGEHRRLIDAGTPAALAGLTQAFMQVETQRFDMLET